MPPPPLPPPLPTGQQPGNLPGRAIFVDGKRKELASPLRRLVARMLDHIILIVPSVVITLALDIDPYMGGDSSIRTYFADIALVPIFGLVYEVTMVATRGQTLGKVTAGITVIRSDNGQIPGWTRSLRRWIVPALLLFVPYVGPLLSFVCYLSLTWGNRFQGWHDMAGGTYVIQNDWGWMGRGSASSRPTGRVVPRTDTLPF